MISFNPMTTIEFDAKEKCSVIQKIYHIRVREVATLAKTSYDADFCKVNFEAQNLTSCIYFYRIQMKNFVAVRKIVLLE